MPPTLTDVTNSCAGSYSGELDVSFAAGGLSETATPGKVWRRIVAAGDALVVHLINLVGQSDTLWDAPRAAFGDPGAARLRFRLSGTRSPRVRVADPDGAERLMEVEVERDGDFGYAELPPLAVWQLPLVET